jgi:hypothetical protein
VHATNTKLVLAAIYDLSLKVDQVTQITITVSERIDNLEKKYKKISKFMKKLNETVEFSVGSEKYTEAKKDFEENIEKKQ